MSVSSKITIFVILVLLLLFLTFMLPVVAHAALLFQDQLRMQPEPDVQSRIGGEALFLRDMG